MYKTCTNSNPISVPIIRMECNIETYADAPLIPPENPLQLAKMNNGRSSRFMSSIACAVLKAESGYQT